MNKKYCIGFFSAVFLCVILLNTAYSISYQKIKARAESEQTEARAAEGTAVKNEGYYLKNRNGYVIVYLSDGQTVYEDTNISLSDLPPELQTEIEAGKYLDTSREIYSFLENYSS